MPKLGAKPYYMKPADGRVGPWLLLARRSKLRLAVRVLPLAKHTLRTHVEAVPGPSIILLAEDCSDDAFFVRRALKTSGLQHSLVHVTNGAECIACLKGEPPYDDRAMFPVPHLVLLDLKMPLLSGFDVLKWLQEQPALQHIPVVILTGSIVPEDQMATRNLGAKAYYTKQADPGALTAILKTIHADWLAARTGLPLG